LEFFDYVRPLVVYLLNIHFNQERALLAGPSGEGIAALAVDRLPKSERETIVV
jgi:hypothetical protein